MQNNNIQTETTNDLQIEKKRYDGSKKPMIRVEQYQSTKAVESAQNRVRLRLDWIKARSAGIQKEYDSSDTAYHIKQTLLAENEKLATEVPLHKTNLKALESRFNELEDQVKKEIQGKTLKPIEIGEY